MPVAVAVAFVVTVLPALRMVTVNDPSPSGTVTAAVSDPGTGPPTPPREQQPIRARPDGIEHRTWASAALARLADGSQLIRRESLDEPGTDSVVFVVPGAEHRQPDGRTRLNPLHE